MGYGFLFMINFIAHLRFLIFISFSSLKDRRL